MQVFNIGRDPGNQVVLNDNMVSRRHAQLIIMDNGQVMIKDLGSSNGTFVNGNKITEAILKPGDIVKCGPVFLNWSQYAGGGASAAVHQQAPGLSYPIEQNQSQAGGNYGLGDVFNYLISGIFNIGDLFKTNWNRTNSIFFLKGIPILLSVFLYLIVQSRLPIPIGDYRIFILILVLFSLPTFLAFLLLSKHKKVSTDKIALASGILGFLHFCVFFLFIIGAWVIISSSITINVDAWDYMEFKPNFFNIALAVFLILLALLVITIIEIGSYVFIFSYFVAIGVRKSVALYFVPTILMLTFFMQVLFFYLLFS